MAKTVRNSADVAAFLESVADPRRRADAIRVCEIFREVTGVEPEMWGTSIVGFGAYHLTYASGQQADWPAAGFAPRKAALTLYLDFDGTQDLLARLGPHTTSKACLYVKKLDAIDLDVLRDLVRVSFEASNGKTVSSS
jgi:hypothetical protein